MSRVHITTDAAGHPLTCLRCLRALRDIGLVAEGLLRAAGEAVS